MDENYQAETMEDTAAAEVMTEATAAAIEDDWYSDGFAKRPEKAEETTDEADSEAPEADQQTESEAVDNQADTADETSDEEGAQQTEEQTRAEEKEVADQRFTLKHLDEVREVGRDEVIALAQKGMDYDRKTQKLSDQIAEYEEFLKEIAAPAGLTTAQLMDTVRARAYRAAEKQAGREISETDALLKIQADRAAKKQAAEQAVQAEAQQKAAEGERQRTEMFQRFADAYPEVKATSIPKEVWDEAAKTKDLVGAYAKHENSALRKEKAELERRIETLETNARNSKRSTGSLKGAGNASAKSAFDDAWYDGT